MCIDLELEPAIVLTCFSICADIDLSVPMKFVLMKKRVKIPEETSDDSMCFFYSAYY